MTAFLLLRILQFSENTSAMLAGSMMMSVCWFTSEMFSHKCTLWWHSLLLKLLQINISLIKILNELACFNYVFCATRLGTHRAAPYSRTAPRVVKLLHTSHRHIWFGHSSAKLVVAPKGAYTAYTSLTNLWRLFECIQLYPATSYWAQLLNLTRTIKIHLRLITSDQVRGICP